MLKLILPLALLISLTTFSQERPLQPTELPGMIITLENDTIYGWIHYADSVTRCKSVKARVGKNDAYTVYTANDIVSYTVDSRKYVSKTVTKMFKGESAVFMEELINDNLQLFAYYFYTAVEKEGKIVSLRDHTFYISTNEYEGVEITRTNFKRKMKQVYNEDNIAMEDIKDGVVCFRYMQESLQNLLRKQEYLAIK